MVRPCAYKVYGSWAESLYWGVLFSGDLHAFRLGGVASRANSPSRIE